METKKCTECTLGKQVKADLKDIMNELEELHQMRVSRYSRVIDGAKKPQDSDAGQE